MEYEQFENTELVIEKKSLIPYDLIMDITETYLPRLKDTKQNIEVTGSQHIEIFAQKDLFIQIVHNLVGNYIKYAGPNTTLFIDISSTQITFYDNGAGIAKRNVPLVFEKFYQ